MNLEDLTEAERKEVLDLSLLMAREIMQNAMIMTHTIRVQAEQMSNTVRERSSDLSRLIDNTVHIMSESSLGDALDQQEQESAAFPFPFTPQEPLT